MATDREKVLEYASNNEFVGLPENYAAVGQMEEPDCKDLLRIGFKTNREIITDIGYELTESACPPMHACAHIICRLARDKAVLEAYLLNVKNIASLITDDGVLSLEHIHCAQMAELALKRAIVEYSRSKA